MCGLAGVFDTYNDQTEMTGKKLLQDLIHRGPDKSSYEVFNSGEVFIGHTRLAIIGLDCGSQPILFGNGKFCLTFNGEITNYKELRKHERVLSDSEVLAILWEDKGIACLSELKGQFVISVYDIVNQELHICTDSVGILPIFVAQTLDGFRYSSSFNSLSEVCNISEINFDAVNEYLLYRYVKSPQTILNGIERIPPGSVWSYEVKRNLLTKTNWELPRNEVSRIGLKEIEFSLTKSFDYSLESDEEVGVFLSGGLDSSLIAAYASLKSNKKVKAFTAYWGENEQSSEVEQARRVANYYHIEHFELLIEANSWLDGFRRAIKFRDAPFGETADIPIFLLAELASKEVKVVLSGEGADEIFLGYPKYKIEMLARNKHWRGIAKFIYPLVESKLASKYKRLLGNVSVENHVQRNRGYFKTLWPMHIENQIRMIVHNDEGAINGKPGSVNETDLQGWLPYLLLDRADRMCMAWGLESRPPFLGQDIVDTLSLVSDKRKVISFSTKPILRKVSRKWLEKDFTEVPKRGFPMPIADWFREDLLTDVTGILSREDSVLDSIVPIEERMKILEIHSKRVQDYSTAIFAMISWISWHENWIGKAVGKGV